LGHGHGTAWAWHGQEASANKIEFVTFFNNIYNINWFFFSVDTRTFLGSKKLLKFKVAKMLSEAALNFWI
jgi:hypothetical protein